MENKHYRALIVTDSRGKIFVEKEPENQDLYITYNIVVSGARIPQLLSETLVRLSTFPTKDIFMVRLGAGINELTKKIHHENGCEVVLNEHPSLWENVLSFKDEIRRTHPNTLVSLCTIPPVDFEACHKFYIQRGWLKKSILTESSRKAQQEELKSILTHTNHLISVENKKEQLVKGAGFVTPSQLYFHQEIERTFTKRKKDGTKKTTKHIRQDTLVDGIHPTRYVAGKWFELVHINFFKEVHKLNFPDQYRIK
jgi:hypothetical protein